MATTPDGPKRNAGREVAAAVATAFAVTLIASLAIFPFGVEFLAVLTPLGSLGLSVLFPILCDVYVARRFFSRRSTLSRNSLLIAGTVLSTLFAFLIWGAFVLAITAPP